MAGIDLSQYERKSPSKGKIDLSRYERQKPIEQRETVSGEPYINTIAKSALKGLMSTADLPNLAAKGIEALATSKANRDLGGLYGGNLDNIPGMEEGSNIQVPEINALSSRIPTTDDFRKYVQDNTGVDLNPRPKDGLGRVLANTFEFPGNVMPFTGLPKAAGLANKAAGLLKPATAAAAVGGVSGLAQEEGVNPLVADLGSSFFTPFAISKAKRAGEFLKNPRQNLSEAAVKLSGLGPKNFKLEAAKAAKDLGIDLPAAALTDSNLTGLADYWVRKIPIFGDRVNRKYIDADNQTIQALDRIYNKIGPEDSPEVQKRISDAYEKHRKLLPADAKVLPSNLNNSINSVGINSPIPSPDEKSVLQTLSTLKHDLYPGLKEWGDILPLEPYDVDRLIGVKKSLNSTIKWDTEKDAKHLLKKLGRGASQDIGVYGETKNPEWYKKFKEADKLFGDVERRKTVEELLGKSIDKDKVFYNALSKSINNSKSKRILKSQRLDPKTSEDIEKLGLVAQAMKERSRNIPNPSGTAATTAAIALVTGLLTNPIATISGSGAGAALGAYLGSKLLSDKKFVDLAIKLAESKNQSNLAHSLALNKRVKDLTGYSAASLNKALMQDAAQTNPEEER